MHDCLRVPLSWVDFLRNKLKFTISLLFIIAIVFKEPNCMHIFFDFLGLCVVFELVKQVLALGLSQKICFSS